MPDIVQGNTCACGLQKPVSDTRCSACRAVLLKKLVKYAVLAGALLGVVCSSVPAQYQAACKSVATLLAAC